MLNNENIKDSIIREINAEGRATLIKSALQKETNRKVIENDFNEKSSKSKERFEKARTKFGEEQRVFNSAPTENAKIVLEKHIKSISSKLEALGF